MPADFHALNEGSSPLNEAVYRPVLVTLLSEAEWKLVAKDTLHSGISRYKRFLCTMVVSYHSAGHTRKIKTLTDWLID